jgi:hypothetical protein
VSIGTDKVQIKLDSQLKAAEWAPMGRPRPKKSMAQKLH